MESGDSGLGTPGGDVQQGPRFRLQPRPEGGRLGTPVVPQGGCLIVLLTMMWFAITSS